MIKPFRLNIFDILNHFLLGLFAVSTVYPLIYVVSASISSANAVITGEVILLPRDITFAAYKHVFETSGIWIAYANTIFYTVLGTTVQMFVTTTGAYALSKKRLMGRTAITFMIVLTMWFSAGMIPFFLNIRDLGLYNSRWSIIVAFACTPFYVIIMRTYFQSIPEAMEESAVIDGANDIKIFSKIYLPLSAPMLATLTLFYGVSNWNSYFWSMVLLRDESKIPLQVLLRKLIVMMQIPENVSRNYDVSVFSQQTFIYATIVVSIIPILIVYPTIQRYFVRGIMLGAIKE
jgi:putative aldouronate transport system permease protein